MDYGVWCMRGLGEKVSPILRDTQRLQFWGLGVGCMRRLRGIILGTHQGCNFRDKGLGCMRRLIEKVSPISVKC